MVEHKGSTRVELGVRQGMPQMIEVALSEIKSPLDLPSWAKELANINYLPKRVVIADPLSYCAGVVRADIGIEEMFAEYPDGFYIYHAPIHNDTKLKEWEAQGAQLIHDANELREIPDESPLYISAHGTGPDIWRIIREKRLRGKDASCPLVDKTHREVETLVRDNFCILLVGYENHDEIVGTKAIAPDRVKVIHPQIDQASLNEILDSLDDVQRLGLRSQTTLDYENLSGLIEYIQERRPDLNLPKKDGICYATHDRQEAVIEAISKMGVELMIIFGSDENKRQPSSNTIRLREVSNNNGAKMSQIVEDISEIQFHWFNGISRVGVSAGASADPKRVAEFLMCLEQIGMGSDRLQRITAAEEPQVFSPVRNFDYSQ